MSDKKEKKGLPRRKWSSTEHGIEGSDEYFAGCGGRVVALYIFKDRKWLKIGEYCQRCGAVAVFPKFQKGLP